LEENDPLFTALQPVLASVRQVHLAVEIGAKRGSLSSCVPHSIPETWLVEFLKLVPRLQTLHLYLNGKSRGHGNPDTLKKNQYHEAVALFFRESQLQCLSCLKLCDVTIRADKFQHFVTFLKRYADQLTRLTLTSIIIDDPENR
jgi:hypothetical protein